MLPLKSNGFPVEIDAEDTRLSAVPGKTDDFTGGSPDVLEDILLKKVIGHAKYLGIWKEAFLPQIVTISAGKVAPRASRLDENLKVPPHFHQRADVAIISIYSTSLVE